LDTHRRKKNTRNVIVSHDRSRVVMRAVMMIAVLLSIFGVGVMVMVSAQPIYGASIIVKNEEAILPRLLDSLKPWVSYYCVCDTGSTDNTVSYMIGWLKENQIDGHVYQDAWVSFGWNRNLCLQRINQVEGLTHILLPDADFELVVHNATAFRREYPPFDLNMISYSSSLFHRQPLLIAAGKRCGYLGRTHEALICVDNDNAFRMLMSESKSPTKREIRETLEESYDEFSITPGPYDAIQFHHHYDGGMRASKFQRDATLLYEDLTVDPDNPRAWFYYAQSQENLGQDYQAAYEAYKVRADMSTGLREERWYSMYRMGYCAMLNNSQNNNNNNKIPPQALDVATKHFLEAYDFNPIRREPLYALAGFYRLARKWSLCTMFALQALTIPFPSSVYANFEAFAVEVSVYEWKAADEAAVCLGELGRYQEAVKGLEGAIKITEARGSYSTLTGEQRTRLRGNLNRLREKAGMTASSSSPQSHPSSPPPPPPPTQPSPPPPASDTKLGGPVRVSPPLPSPPMKE